MRTVRYENEDDEKFRQRIKQTLVKGNDLLEYIMAIPTVYSCSDDTNNIQMDQQITITSRLPLSNEDFERIREHIPIMYIVTVKNIYKGGENIVNLSF